MDPVFCRIWDGQLPSIKVTEDERALGIMNTNPVSDGHVLILTKRHAETLFEMTEEELVTAAPLA